MKKIAFAIIILNITGLLLTPLNSAAQSAFGPCINGKPDIPEATVRNYMKNYRILVVAYGRKAAWQLVSLSDEAMDCLSKEVDSVKFIAASTSATHINKITTIVELCKNGACSYYDTNVLFPGDKNKIPARTCPPPSNCGVPITDDKKKH